VTSATVRIDPGTAIGPYVVDRRLAKGGMSVLYLARDPDGELLVLKMVPPEIGTAATRARLMREARALASVDHPGIVRVHGTGEHEGIPWIAMDYVRGTDLKRVLSDNGPLPVDAALRYAIQAAEALVAAHDAGVIHRDLKPSNLLLTPEGRLVLVDFGIAKRRSDARDGDVLTSAREVLGTPAYLSPEQLEHGLADERSDVWALGCVLYEMCVGEPPFGRGGSSTTAAILRDEPLFPPGLSGAIVHVVGACLRKSSFARIASPRELLLLLRDALDDPQSELAAAPERTSSQMKTRSSSPVQARGSSQSPARASSQGPARTSVRPSTRPSAPPPAGSVGNTPIPARRSGSTRPPSMPPGRATSSTMRVAAPRGRIKGTAVRAGIAWFAETYGEMGLERVVELASPELQSLLRIGDPVFGLIASGWYDTYLIGELLEDIERVAAPADPVAFQSRVADAIARDNVGGVYRALFRLVASPPLLEANAQRVWRTYIDEGTLAVSIGKPGTFEARVRGWSRHHPTVCRMLRAMLESLLRAVGYTGLVVERTGCVGFGEACCTFEGVWAP
jgi:serine/threonine protein kinase